ncbi:MAG: helix-turn-helix domain-containing protein [Dehalobacter sp. 4CP]|nr:helix-turn-helix domain-containing protein [Dehalobacter sp. 4CP]
MPEVRRVVLDIDVYDALKAEALVRHDNLKSTLASMVMENLSPEAREVLKCIRDKKSPKANMDIMPCGPVAVDAKKRRLSENPDALEQIRQMWKDGEHNQAEIARRIGYHRATVNDTIKRMKEAGELE